MNLQKIEKSVLKFFIILVVLVSSNVLYAKTYTRSCKATIQIIPKDGNINKVILHEFQGKGKVDGYFPNKARRRARENIIECVNALWQNDPAYIPTACRESNKVYNFIDNPSPLTFKAYLKKRLQDANIDGPNNLESDVKIRFDGDRGCGGGIKFGKNGTIKLGTIKPTAIYHVCGDGDIDPGELCDNGSNNSDTKPNACRTNCVPAGCGDGIVDSGEQCDGDNINQYICSDFSQYHSHLPGDSWHDSLSCTDDCKFDFSECARCGDGITQSPQEECDDGNSVDDDGCNIDCTACINVNENLDITQNTELCTKNYVADDYGDLGAIIIKAPNVTLNCDGAKITGQGDRVGIYIKSSDNVTVMNCLIDNYEYGIYAEDSQNIRILNTGNKITNTVDQVVLDESSVDPTPPPSPSTQPQGSLIGKVPMVILPSPRLTTSRIDSKHGDQLKMNLINKGKGRGVKKPSIPKRDIKTPTRKVPVVREPRPQPKPVVSPTKVRTPISKPAQQTQPMPSIIFPKAKQRFTYPVRMSVKANYDKRRKVVYVVKRLSDKRVIRRTSRAIIDNLPVGDYCLQVSYIDKGRVSSACIEFSVVKKPIKTLPRIQKSIIR